VKENNAYKADEAVGMPVLIDSRDKAAHDRFAAAITLGRIHPEVVITTNRHSQHIQHTQAVSS